MLSYRISAISTNSHQRKYIMNLSKTKELENHLLNLFATISSGTFKIDPTLSEWEATNYMAGMAAGVFAIDELGYAQSTHIDKARPGQQRQQLLQLFWTRNGRFLFREGVCQLAATSALILQYKWPSEQVYLDPGKSVVGELRWAVDLIVTNGAMGQAIICGEVKRYEKDLKTLISQFTDCCRRGAHDEAECNNSQHRKFEACWHLKPDYFWAVCPTSRKAYKLDFKKDHVVMIEVEDIPRPTPHTKS